MPIREEAINVFMGLPGRRRPSRADLQPRRRLVRARHRLQPHRADRRRPRRDARAAGREGHRAGEAAVPRPRGRLPHLLRPRPGRLPHRADREVVSERRLAVVDLGSNSFRLVVFTWEPGQWLKRTDEIHEAVRIGEGLDATGVLAPEPMERALETVELYAHFCRATGIDDVRAVATSAIRDATNRDEFLRRAALDVQVLSPEEEAYYGYLAAVNSTTLSDGVVLDLGGGSMQLTRVEDRQAARHALVAARRRAHDRALPGARAGQAQAPQGAARARGGRARGPRVAETAASWSASAARSATSRRRPSCGGAAVVRRPGLPAAPRARSTTLVERLAELTPAERGKVPGIKPERGDLILAGALVVQTVMEVGGFDGWRSPRPACARACSSRPASRTATRRCSRTCARASVRNLAAQYDTDLAHTEHVARLALEIWDELGQRRPGRARAAVGRGDAARHRHVDRLRRPPQALALPDAQRRPAGLLPARDRADRPDGALPPQGHARARRVRARSAATATRSCWSAARPCCGSRSSSSARATRRSTRDGGRRRRQRQAAPGGARGRDGRALGRERQARPLREGVRARARGQRGPAGSARRPDGDELALGRRPRRPPPRPPRGRRSGSASQVTRIMPVATRSSPTTMRPQMTSPSSQPMRSTSNHDRWTAVGLAAPRAAACRGPPSPCRRPACSWRRRRVLTAPRVPRD